jgi:putative transposase
MYGELKKDIADILKHLCEMSEAELIEGTVCADHVHIYIAIPPKICVSKFMLLCHNHSCTKALE